MSHDVFICHSSKDRTIANAICSALEQHRIRCWIAPRDVLPGSDYAQSIIEAIHGSRLTVLVFSEHSNQSPHIRRELERAVSLGIPILPFRVQDVLPSPSLEYFISGAHWLDAITPPVEKHLEYLVGTVQMLLEREAVSASAGAARVPSAVGADATPGKTPSAVLPAPAPLPPPATTTPPRRKRTWLWAGLGVVVVAAVVIALMLGGVLGAGTSGGDAPATQPSATATAWAGTGTGVAKKTYSDHQMTITQVVVDHDGIGDFVVRARVRNDGPPGDFVWIEAVFQSRGKEVGTASMYFTFKAGQTRDVELTTTDDYVPWDNLEFTVDRIS